MVFKSYYVKELVGSSLVDVEFDKEVGFFGKINKFNRIIEGTQSYEPLYLKSYNNYILGTLAQSYDTILTKFKSDEKGEITLADTKINDKLYFYIDTDTNILFIQNKRYPSRTLNKSQTSSRIEKILTTCLNKAVKLMPANIDYSVDKLIEIFQHSYVKKIVFKNLKGIELPQGTVIHNPREDLDKAVVESYNYYSKDTLEFMEFGASKEESLNKNPLVKLGLKLAEIGNDNGKEVLKCMEIIDDGVKVNMKPKGNNSLVINVQKDDLDDSYEVYEKILKKNIKDYKGRLDE